MQTENIPQQLQELANRRGRRRIFTKATLKNFSPAGICKNFRDWYVRSMLACSAQTNFGGFGGAPELREFSRSTSVASEQNHQDFHELIRVASERASASGRQYSTSSVPRSVSVNVARIDENSPSQFTTATPISMYKVHTASRSAHAAYHVGRRSLFPQPAVATGMNAL
eukprot:c20790_g1_i1 orf=459-965(-)